MARIKLFSVCSNMAWHILREFLHRQRMDWTILLWNKLLYTLSTLNARGHFNFYYEQILVWDQTWDHRWFCPILNVVQNNEYNDPFSFCVESITLCQKMKEKILLCDCNCFFLSYVITRRGPFRFLCIYIYSPKGLFRSNFLPIFTAYLVHRIKKPVQITKSLLFCILGKFQSVLYFQGLMD